MSNSVQVIPLANLALAFIPVAIVVVVLYRWSLDARNAVYAIARMLIQLLLIGYVLTHIFAADNSLVIIAVLTVMLLVASWIALRSLHTYEPSMYLKLLAAISLGGVTTLALISHGVVGLEPWYAPNFLVPLAGMIFANAMNTVSLAAERFAVETARGANYEDARRDALRASLIPLINSLFAVGVVALPGMMTGQILSGVSPLIAARYQIVVMCMIFGSAGISAAFYLFLLKKHNIPAKK